MIDSATIRVSVCLYAPLASDAPTVISPRTAKDRRFFYRRSDIRKPANFRQACGKYPTDY